MHIHTLCQHDATENPNRPKKREKKLAAHRKADQTEAKKYTHTPWERINKDRGMWNLRARATKKKKKIIYLVDIFERLWNMWLLKIMAVLIWIKMYIFLNEKEKK